MEFKKWQSQGRFLQDAEAEIERQLPALEKQHAQLTEAKGQTMKRLDLLAKTLAKDRDEYSITVDECEADLLAGKSVGKVKAAAHAIQAKAVECQQLQSKIAQQEAQICGIEVFPLQTRRSALLEAIRDAKGGASYRLQAASDELHRLENLERETGVIGVSGTANDLLLLASAIGFPENQFDKLLAIWLMFKKEKIDRGGISFHPQTGQLHYQHQKVDPLKGVLPVQSGQVVSG